MPALLVESKDKLRKNEKNRDISDGIIIGHIHSDLVRSLRTKLDERGNEISFNHPFLFPPSLDDGNPESAAGRYFGFRVDSILRQESTATRTSERNALFERFTELLIECEMISKKHTDMYPIVDLKETGRREILGTINRNAAPYLGITSIGVHLLCYVRDDASSSNETTNSNKKNNVSLWLAQRAANKSHNALRWDPTVAGGQPASMGLFDNVIKEAGEEAGIDPGTVVRNAVATGCLSQMTCKENGTCMKQSLYYTWDMKVDRDFIPHPADGEVAEFKLFSAEELEYEVRCGNRLRPAMILVVADFLIRHGVITPDNETDYAEILASMHQKRLVLGHSVQA
eukprot:jgi/Psemu1/306243/fgenesh1_kg.244_\